MQNKKVDFELLGKGVEVSTDLDQDGVKSIRLKLNLLEAYQESLKRGESVRIEGVKAVTLKMDGLSLNAAIDTDRDGESIMEIDINLPEILDETIS